MTNKNDVMHWGVFKFSYKLQKNSFASKRFFLEKKLLVLLQSNPFGS
jgi:hypothetical protein